MGINSYTCRKNYISSSSHWVAGAQVIFAGIGLLGGEGSRVTRKGRA